MVFHKELAIFDWKLTPPVAYKNALYVHEGDEPIEEETLAQDDAVLDNGEFQVLFLFIAPQKLFVYYIYI